MTNAVAEPKETKRGGGVQAARTAWDPRPEGCREEGA